MVLRLEDVISMNIGDGEMEGGWKRKGGEEERCDEGQIDEKNGGYDQKRRMSRNVRMHTEM